MSDRKKTIRDVIATICIAGIAFIVFNMMSDYNLATMQLAVNSGTIADEMVKMRKRDEKQIAELLEKARDGARQNVDLEFTVEQAKHQYERTLIVGDCYGATVFLYTKERLVDLPSAGDRYRAVGKLSSLLGSGRSKNDGPSLHVKCDGNSRLVSPAVVPSDGPPAPPTPAAEETPPAEDARQGVSGRSWYGVIRSADEIFAGPVDEQRVERADAMRRDLERIIRQTGREWRARQ